MNKIIPFSPPDINEDDIEEVVKTLRSGWITTGAKCKEFESLISGYTNSKNTNVLGSATAAMETALRLLGIGDGDEIITTPYTYAATANVIVHTGAKVVFADVKKDTFSIDPKKVESLINEKTKAVIGVDIAGYPCDYDEIKNAIENKKTLFRASENIFQNALMRVMFMLDSAHSFGAMYKDKRVGSFADFNAFSFHAVKNLTTAEGGSLTYNDIGKIESEFIYKEVAKLALHGQSKNAFEKTSGSYKYDIEMAGYKCNMSDIHASLGVSQFKRYANMLSKRKKLFDAYDCIFSKSESFILPPFHEKNKTSSFHIYPLRIKGFGEKERDDLIAAMKEKGISLNVHFIPVVMHSAYKKLGYRIEDYPNAYEMYKNEVSLPLYSALLESDAEYVAKSIMEYVK